MPTALQRSRDILAHGVARLRAGIVESVRQQGDVGPAIKVEPFDAKNVSTPAALIKLGTSIAAARRDRANYDQTRRDLAITRLAATEKATLEDEKTRAETAHLKAQTTHELNPTARVIPMDEQLVPEGPYKGKTFGYARLDLATRSANKPEDAFAPMDDTTLRMAALNYAKGGGLPPLGMSKQSAVARMNIMGYAAHHFPALDVAANKADMVANAAALKGAVGSLTFAKSYGDQLERNADTIKGLLGKIPDTGARWSNTIVRSVLPQFASGTNIPEYDAAVEFVGNEANRLLTASPATGSGQITDQGKKEIRAVVNKNFTKRDMLGVLGILSRDKNNRVASYSNQIDLLRDKMSWNEFGAQPRFTPGGQPEAPQPSGDVEWIMDANGNLVQKQP